MHGSFYVCPDMALTGKLHDVQGLHRGRGAWKAAATGQGSGKDSLALAGEIPPFLHGPELPQAAQ